MIKEVLVGTLALPLTLCFLALDPCNLLSQIIHIREHEGAVGITLRDCSTLRSAVFHKCYFAAELVLDEIHTFIIKHIIMTYFFLYRFCKGEAQFMNQIVISVVCHTVIVL